MKKRIIAVVLALIIALSTSVSLGCVAFAEDEVHQHEYVYSKTVNRTCEGDGYDLYVCSCGSYIYKNITEATGHYDGNDDGRCDYCNDLFPQYFFKFVINMFLQFLKEVLGIK